jgi:hypothetical protein
MGLDESEASRLMPVRYKASVTEPPVVAGLSGIVETIT